MPPWMQQPQRPFRPHNLRPFPRGLPGRPMGWQPSYPMQQPGLRGFLQRILGRGQTQPPPPLQMGNSGNPFAQAGQTAARSVISVDNISNFLNQTQQVLRTAQQIGPLIQQYGPLIKNLPSLWKIYQEFRDTGGEEADQEDRDQREEEEDLQSEELEIENDKIEDQADFEKNGENTPAHEKDNNKKNVAGKTVKNFDARNSPIAKSKRKEKDPSPKPSVPKLYI